ncbi:hypothetical protein Slin15195_G029280 [Septoria linicola]|uniref:Uncharacterized protein n=1 Tax=Septoria linicola TaxID=215465 RepID=A0A9Q9AHQ5_9PEZI|nr:hypothetical protein Slin14017_G028310 [Septoria linicola]USW49609.1 hypothetical protein Slin15195_G029280 [Septoria linicola]
MWALLPLVIIGAARAQSNGLDAYLTSVCMPTNSSGYPDFDVSCNAVAAIQAQCIYGAGYLDVLSEFYGSSLKEDKRKRAAADSSGDDNDPMVDNRIAPEQSNETQRVCLCESQFWDQISGCLACYKAHGGDMASEASVPKSALTSASSAYCAASATATAGLADYLFAFINNFSTTSASRPTGTASVRFRDSIGNKTEVSYYYTAAATGTAAWSISQPTNTSGSASYTTTNIVDGQIRPTNVAATSSISPSGSNGSNGNATETGNVAGRYEVVGAAGIFGLAGLLALL